MLIEVQRGKAFCVYGWGFGCRSVLKIDFQASGAAVAYRRVGWK